MQLNQFELNIHALILEQGNTYFEQGAVLELMETPEGWRSVIKGKGIYHVLIIGKDIIQDWNCDCPYDHGPVCKHVAATFFAIREKSSKKTELRKKVKTLLESSGRSELETFLQAKLMQSEQLRKEFIDYFEEE